MDILKTQPPNVIFRAWTDLGNFDIVVNFPNAPQLLKLFVRHNPTDTYNYKTAHLQSGYFTKIIAFVKTNFTFPEFLGHLLGIRSFKDDKTKNLVKVMHHVQDLNEDQYDQLVLPIIMAPIAKQVKVRLYIQGLNIDTNNFLGQGHIRPGKYSFRWLRAKIGLNDRHDQQG